MSKEPVKHWRYFLPSENGEGYAIIFIDSTGVFSAVSDYGNYGYIWGNTGSKSIKEFLLKSETDWHYFAKKLDPKEIVDWDDTRKRIEEYIKSDQRGGQYDGDARRELQLLENSNISDEYSFQTWYNETKIQDAHELQRRRLSYQVEMFVKQTMKRLCTILRKELEAEATGAETNLIDLKGEFHKCLK